MSLILLQSVTLTSDQSQVDITGIDQSGKDLVIFAELRSDTSGTPPYAWMRFNNDSTSSYSSNLIMFIDGGRTSPSNPAGTNVFSLGVMPNSSTYPNVVGGAEIEIYDYTSSLNKQVNFKSPYSNNSDAAENYSVAEGGGYWDNTSAITSITFGSTSGGYDSRSAFYIYKRASNQ